MRDQEERKNVIEHLEETKKICINTYELVKRIEKEMPQFFDITVDITQSQAKRYNSLVRDNFECRRIRDSLYIAPYTYA